MRVSTFDSFYRTLYRKEHPLPREAQWELTYRCPLRCGHCYCRGMEKPSRELPLKEIKKILQNLKDNGVLWLIFTGGEPLLHPDFLSIYSFARQKGFVITIFTNGLLLNDKIIRALKKSPPYSIEITVNGITKKTYEAVTGITGSFEQFSAVMPELFRSGLPIVIKTNLLKINQNEISGIKRWVRDNFGKPGMKHFFKYDPFIYSRMNGDKAPLKWRLSFLKIQKIIAGDSDMRRQYEEELYRDFPGLEMPADYLYQCSIWRSRLFISPEGIVRFCPFSDKYNFDLKELPIEEGYRKFSSISEEKFKTPCACRGCKLRPLCAWCPVKAGLETGNEEKKVAAYCRYAKQLAEATRKSRQAVMPIQ